MLVIGHRGAAGEKPENTLASIRAGLASGADMIECDVRFTKDRQLVLMHDSRLKRTHDIDASVRELSLHELQKRTAGSARPICTLKEVLEIAHDKIMINIELKEKGTGKAALEVCRDYGISSKDAWQSIIFSSFSGRELSRLRKLNQKVQLALLHHINPYLFVAWDRSLRLSAVGFHRLYAPKMALEIARQQKIFTYAYTVNRVEAAKRLEQSGLDGIVTDYPTKLAEHFN